MKTMTKMLSVGAVLTLAGSLAFAKLPAPSDEAKAKAAEAAAKTAWVGKVDGYLLCKSQDKVVAYYKKAPVVKGAAPVVSTCVDPGPFVYTPAAPAGAAPAGAAPAAAAPALAASQAKKS